MGKKDQPESREIRRAPANPRTHRLATDQPIMTTRVVLGIVQNKRCGFEYENAAGEPTPSISTAGPAADSEQKSLIM
jgi:hypothetical protein